MKVTLIENTSPLAVVKATAMPYQSKESLDVVGRVWDSGYRSVARHGTASFLVEGVSQSLLRQLSRHPHINLTVKSSRYCDMAEVETVIPPFISMTDRFEFNDDYEKIMCIYKKWASREAYSRGQRQELAKLMLPLGSTTNLVLSGNYQALYEFIQLRLCVRAEWEIRELAQQIRNMLVDIMPVIFERMGCKGDELRYCPEINGGYRKHPIMHLSKKC
ncbi:thymidylate synthase, flavin-dependent [Desulfofarcimen acetoxidans DSM 771]|uniref:FAD-dependent thymidylate synthase n=1 Tax=Desulfofarcimen acetoxidans (strain ATCC 49208 / DSM 771 / KCTC 5769 / VKM B-1644 / 5575) TaxID=485916 RepID=C8VXS2_DESAS|nr:FAD-dependent thymidylate synthase [Desulfofarcimen acetoxidans]ACV62728.1 thymidylate synthase, flavin-dependent [Desulfofarcimen acetoxidans DSM 771]